MRNGTTTAASPRPQRGPATVVLVQDDPDQVVLVRRALRNASVRNELIVLADGVQARDYLFGVGTYLGRDPRDVPALVLLDLKVPRISGIDLLRRIRAHPDTALLPVVVLTSSQLDEEIVRSYGLGASWFLRKPTEFAAFDEAIRQIAERWLTPLGPSDSPEQTDDSSAGA